MAKIMSPKELARKLYEKRLKYLEAALEKARERVRLLEEQLVEHTTGRKGF